MVWVDQGGFLNIYMTVSILVFCGYKIINFWVYPLMLHKEISTPELLSKIGLSGMSWIAPVGVWSILDVMCIVSIIIIIM